MWRRAAVRSRNISPGFISIKNPYKKIPFFAKKSIDRRPGMVYNLIVGEGKDADPEGKLDRVREVDGISRGYTSALRGACL